MGKPNQVNPDYPALILVLSVGLSRADMLVTVYDQSWTNFYCVQCKAAREPRHLSRLLERIEIRAGSAPREVKHLSTWRKRKQCQCKALTAERRRTNADCRRNEEGEILSRFCVNRRHVCVNLRPMLCIGTFP